MKLDTLRHLALRHLAEGDFVRALRIYGHIITRLPTDLDARMRVGDVCTQAGQLDAAKRVYASVAWLDLQGGRPLHALIAMQALSDLGEDVAPLREALAQVYGAGSQRVAKVGGRLSPPLPDSEIDAPSDQTKDDANATLARAVEAACEVRTITSFPPVFQPVPLLSELSDKAFERVLRGASVHRLGHGQTVMKKGDPGDAFYLLAAGQVRVTSVDTEGNAVELARLHEGSIFGEMALIRAEPRSASVDVVGSADLICFGRSAIQAAAEELPAVATALDRFTRDRLLKSLLATSPMFRPFDAAQRLELLRRFTGHEVAAGTDVITRGEMGRGLYLVLSGELEVLGGDAPFEQVLALLGPGECFGEISLLGGRPTTATVRARRDGSVLFLPREYFERLMSALPSLREWFDALSTERLERTRLTLDVVEIEDEELLF